MARHVFVVLSNPVEGKDKEFNDWYTDRHMHDTLKIPGFVSAQRFVAAAKSDTQAPPYRYLAVYEVDTDDVQATHAKLAQAVDTPAMPWSDALDRSAVLATYFRPITEKVQR